MSAPGVSQELLDSIGTPLRVATPIGELEFFDGLPADATAASVYDHLDLMRGVEVFLSCLTAASNYAMREGYRSVGIRRSNQVGVVDRLDSSGIYLTGNTETAYGINYLDLKPTARSSSTCRRTPSASSTTSGSASSPTWA